MNCSWQRIATRLRTELYALLSSGREFYVDMEYPKAKLELCQGIRFNSCDKEPETVEWIESFGCEDIFYDIGACVGTYSLVASKHAMAVYAFEPAYFNFNLLMRNIQRNAMRGNTSWNIIPVCNPLARRTGMLSFNYMSTKDGSSMHVLGSDVDYNGKVFEPEFCQPMFAFSLDDFIERFGILRPHHIKLDVDGTELDILKGAARTLRSKRLKSILVEIDIGRSEKDIIALLKSHGFKVARKVVRRKEIANYIFRRK
jgi:FkbM family methyltransferase